MSTLRVKGVIIPFGLLLMSTIRINRILLAKAKMLQSSEFSKMGSISISKRGSQEGLILLLHLFQLNHKTNNLIVYHLSPVSSRSMIIRKYSLIQSHTRCRYCLRNIKSLRPLFISMGN